MRHGARRWATAAVATSVALMGASARAWACSPPPPRISVADPLPNAPARPRNHGFLVASSAGPFTATIRAPEIRVLSGAQAVLVAGSHEGLWFVPGAELTAGESHLLEVRPSTPEVATLVDTVAFTTTDVVDRTPPTFGGLTGLRVEFRRPKTSCDPPDGWYATLRWTPTSETSVVTFFSTDAAGEIPADLRQAGIQAADRFGLPPNPRNVTVPLAAEPTGPLCFGAGTATDLAGNQASSPGHCCWTPGSGAEGKCSAPGSDGKAGGGGCSVGGTGAAGAIPGMFLALLAVSGMRRARRPRSR